jgi:hypothetical protein
MHSVSLDHRRVITATSMQPLIRCSRQSTKREMYYNKQTNTSSSINDVSTTSGLDLEYACRVSSRLYYLGATPEPDCNYGAEPWRVGSCVMLLSMPVAAIFCTMGCWRHLLRGVCLWDPSS